MTRLHLIVNPGRVWHRFDAPGCDAALVADMVALWCDEHGVEVGVERWDSHDATPVVVELAAHMRAMEDVRHVA